MGGKSTKITYETVDKTDPQAQERGRQAAMEENNRLVAEMMQQMRQREQEQMNAAMAQVQQQNERDARRAAENKQKREQEEAKRQQEEHKRKEKLAVLKMKEFLLAYEFGKKLTMATFHGEGLDVNDMKRVRVALFGPAGSGKTSFIGTLERSLLGAKKQTAFEQGAGAEGTVVLEEYLSQLRFNLVDTRGFWNIDDSTADECLKIMTGRINIGSEIQRDYDMEEEAEPQMASKRACAKFGDRVHAVIFVVRANDTRLKDKTYLTRMKKIRDHFRFEGHSPVTVITCEDKLKTKQDRETAFHEASAATGSPQDRTYFITNYTHEHKNESIATEKAALNIMDTVLLSAERFVKIQKLREEHHGSSAMDVDSQGAPSGGETVKHFFRRLQTENDLDPERTSRAIDVITNNEINTVDALKGCWEEIKGDLQLTIGMRNVITKALKVT